MEESFWERKGIKGAFAWIAIDIIALVLFAVTGFDRELIIKLDFDSYHGNQY